MISAAEAAFWHLVATAFPECQHGDEPGDLGEFDRVLHRAVSDWLVCNWPPERLAAARVRVERELRAAGWDTVADEVAAGVAFHTLLKRLNDLGLGQSAAAYIVADAAHNAAGTED